MTKRDFIFRAKANGSTLTVVQLSAAYDALAASIPADPMPPAVDDTPRAESDRVSAWLAGLKESAPENFAALRVKSFADQRAAWMAAGSP